jgi:hypothetical protein
MNLVTLNATINALKQQLQVFENIRVCCHSCERFGEIVPQQCAVHQATPPTDWIKGPIECEHWSHDSVPF